MAEIDHLIERVRVLHHEAGEALGGIGRPKVVALQSAGLEAGLISQLAPKLAAVRAAAVEYVATYDELKGRGAIP